MQQIEARKILLSLIQGRNPASGESLPSECVVHDSDVIRALLFGVSAIEATDARAKRRAALPANVAVTGPPGKRSNCGPNLPPGNL